MKWNFEPTGKTDQECPHCGLFYSDRGIKAHRANCPLKGEDYWVRRPDSLEDGEGGDAPDDAGAPVETESNDDVGPDPSTHTSPPSDSGEATTDGGRRAPPQPSIDVDDDEDDDPVDVDDLPDRFVPVEDYVERKSRREDVDGDRLAERLEDYDVVDVESYTGDRIEAYTLEEVAES
jgi:hypothetical protein